MENNNTNSHERIVASEHNQENIGFGFTVENDLKIPLVSQTKTLNLDYSVFMFYSYMFLYCIPGFYYGCQLSIMTNLGKPIIKNSFKILDSDKMSSLLGVINLSFGIGKLSASILAGSIAKQLGKHNVLYIGLITNVISCI